MKDTVTCTLDILIFLSTMQFIANGSKTRSLGQILEKPCVRSRGHIFSLIIMNVRQNVCLDKISDEFENGSYWFKKLGL